MLAHECETYSQACWRADDCTFCPPLFSLLAHAASFEPDVRLRGRDVEAWKVQGPQLGFRVVRF